MKLKDARFVGKKVRCPGCQQPFTVQALGSPAAKAARPSRASQPDEDIDFLDPDDVAAEQTSGGDDDWLAALDSLPPAKAGTPAAAPPPVAGRRKKSDSGAGKKRKRQWRDADGEFPPWVHNLLMIGAGLVAGVLTCAIWAGLIYRTGFSNHYFALIVGASIGGAVRLGASKWDFGWGPAMTASVIAFVAIMAGKIIGVNILMAESRQEQQDYVDAKIALMQHPNYLIRLEATEIMMEELEAGVATDWGEAPIGEEEFDEDYDDPTASLDPERLEQLHPPRLWAAAEERWEARPPEEQAERKQEIDAEIALMQELDPGDVDDFEQTVRIRGAGRIPTGTRVLHPLDFVFSLLAVAAAFKIAAGFSDEDDD